VNTPCGQHQHPHRLIQQPLDELTDRLRRNSRRVTGPRQAILDVLRRHQTPMSNREIHAALGQGCDLATVYRNLHTLEGMGLVRRFDLGDGAARFELVTPEDDGHHHHLVCLNCGTSTDVGDCGIDAVTTEAARRSGFEIQQHRLELFGTCPDCQSKKRVKR
jgi:Fe2+ or Zn2+ uptake regulation protein